MRFRDYSLKDFESCIKEFRDKELRAIFYDIAVSCIQRGCVKKALKVLLLSWNWRAYSGSGLDKLGIERQFDEIIDEYSKSLKPLEEFALEEIDFAKVIDGLKINIRVENFFDSLKRKTAIGSTGASKLMHLLNRDLFVMWDDDIAEKYHREISKENHFRKHEKKSGACYVEFLRDMQKFAQDLKKKIDKSDKYESTAKFLESISLPEYKSTIPKLLDEYNYVRYHLEDNNP